MLTTLRTPIVKSQTFSQVEIVSVTDRYQTKECVAEVVVEGIGQCQLTLWKNEGDKDAYSAAGQWTDDDIRKRVLDILDEQLKS